MAKNIQNAAGYGNIEEIQRFMKKGISINDSGHYGLTPLMNAVLHFQNSAALFLIENGADVNQIDDFGRTALIHGAFSGNLEGVKILLDQGADKYLKDHDDMTALEYAEDNRHVDIANLLKWTNA